MFCLLYTSYPWILYQQTGDRSILETNWEEMNHYMDWLKNNERAAYQAPAIQRNGFGDWLAFQGTGYEVIADYYYGYVTQLMEQMAGILGDAEKQSYYSERFENLKQTFLNTHVSFNDEPQLDPTIFEQPTTDNPGTSNIITNTFNETTAKYVRFTVSRTGPGTSDDNEYLLSCPADRPAYPMPLARLPAISRSPWAFGCSPSAVGLWLSLIHIWMRKNRLP